MDEVSELLSSWELTELIDTFTDNGITLQALSSLTPDVIKELIPKIGTRVLFLRCWRQWFSEYVGQKPLEPGTSELDISATALEIFTQEAKNDESEDGLQGTVYTLVPADSQPHSVIPPQSEPHQDSTLRKLLEVNLETAGLLSCEGQALSGDSARNLLAAVIAKKILQENKNLSIRGEIYYKWCTEIRKLFPGERTTTFYIPSCKTANGVIHQARGKLVSQVLNTRKRFQKHGALTAQVKRSKESSPATSTHSCPSPRPLPDTFSYKSTDEKCQDASIEEDLIWLRHSSDPWYLVEEKWKSTCANRIRNIHSESGPTIEKYIENYPALKTTVGYSLLEYDFKVAHPDYTEKLFINFPLLKPNILGLLSQRKTKNQFTKEIADLANSPSEEVTNTVAFLAIPLLLRSTVSHVDKKKNKNAKPWKPTQVEACEAFITHVKSNTEIQETIQRRKQKLTDKVFPSQPYCMIVGPSLTEITTYLVVINGHAVYERTNIIGAVDTCFKAIWALNAEYSFDSYATWYFIQRGLYKLTSRFDKGSTAAESLLSDCGITL